MEKKARASRRMISLGAAHFSTCTKATMTATQLEVCPSPDGRSDTRQPRAARPFRVAGRRVVGPAPCSYHPSSRVIPPPRQSNPIRSLRRTPAVPLHFAREEYAQRRAAAIAAMAKSGLDGLLMFRQESMYYLTGYDTFGYVFFQCLYLGADGRM